MSLSKNIKKLRQEKGLSQEKLARLADITHTSLSKIEASIQTNPTMKTLLKLSNALNISLDKLVGRKTK